ncbi:hypothetical protein ACFL6M_04770 [Candidatus Eisenbacteria bacterium]|uniref:Uncharacterized protein n=1 Tax=Eiseniibacteriota bacterium TaxID=2212470 RepID=A0ABV6YKN9_UNCEI
MTRRLNPLEPFLRVFFEKLNFLNAFISNCEISVKRFRSSLAEAQRRRAEHGIPLRGGWSLIIADIADLPQGDAEVSWMNSFPSGKHKLEGDEYFAFVDRISQMQAALTVAQAYELHETYLLDLVTTCVAAHTSDAEATKFKKVCPKEGKYPPSRKADWRELVVKAYRGKNNKDLLAYLRRLAPAVKQYETINRRQFDLPGWYRVLSTVRHATVHQQLVIRGHQLSTLSATERGVLERYFSGVPEDESYRIALEGDDAKVALRTLGEYAYLHFKGLSEQYGYPPMIREAARTANGTEQRETT